MKIAEVIAYLESIAPFCLQETYDNAGLLTGQPDNGSVREFSVHLILRKTVIGEAIEKKCNLIISHHPIIFKPLKRLNGRNYVERTVIQAIKNNIALFAIHTNLDNILEGVNARIADKLELIQRRTLDPKLRH